MTQVLSFIRRKKPDDLKEIEVRAIEATDLSSELTGNVEGNLSLGIVSDLVIVFNHRRESHSEQLHHILHRFVRVLAPRGKSRIFFIAFYCLLLR